MTSTHPNQIPPNGNTNTNLGVPSIIAPEFRGNTDRQSGGINLRLPLWQTDRQLIFADAHFRVGSEDTLAGNFGFAYRNIFDINEDRSDAWIAGLNLFYDGLESENDNYYNRAGIGAEVYNKNFEARFNGYIGGGDNVIATRSITNTRLRPTSTGLGLKVFEQTFNLQASEFQLPGIDFEAGYRGHINDRVSVGIFAGYFHFDSENTPYTQWPDGAGADRS